jgi:pimeloyl-ACP methyl ester carboxylesterase
MGRISTSRSSASAIEHELPWGVVVRGQRWGPAPDRVLLLHEPGADIDAWVSLPARLAQELMIGVAAFDLPGHGLSDESWEPARIGGVVRALLERAELPFRQVLVTAGLTAGVALTIVPQLRHAALVCLSPESPPGVLPPSRSPDVPKLFFASALAGAQLENARTLAGASGGWSNVTSIPTEELGTALLASRWSDQIVEGTVSFARDYLALRAHSPRLRQTAEKSAANAEKPSE